jgi:hypothetical protein
MKYVLILILLISPAIKLDNKDIAKNVIVSNGDKLTKLKQPKDYLYETVINFIYKHELGCSFEDLEDKEYCVYDDNGYRAIYAGLRTHYLDTPVVCINKYEGDMLLRKKYDENIKTVKYNYPNLTPTQILAVAHLSYAWGIGSVIKSEVIKNNEIDTTILYHRRTIDSNHKYRKNREFEYNLFYK